MIRRKFLVAKCQTDPQHLAFKWRVGSEAQHDCSFFGHASSRTDEQTIGILINLDGDISKLGPCLNSYVRHT